MKIALDPYMIRNVPLLELPAVVAELGYEWIELSPREDFIPFFRHPRVDDATVRKFRKALDSAGVGVSSVLPLFRWSGPDEEARQAAIRYWKRAIRITADLGVDSMISELNGRPEDPDRSEAQFWKSMDDLLPLLEQEGIRLTLEPHPDDFIENGHDAINLIRGINHPNVSFLYCAPHTFHIGNDAPGIIKHAGDLLTHVHLADALDHTASSGNRYILNPPGTSARIHQHLDIGQGEVDFDELFRELRAHGFDGTLTACVFAWEERAKESSVFMRKKIDEYLATWS
ncbi:sugar phosphate isomerase/epimerase family protein [Streptomyces mirabilis]|uniref:sugar phosphate isomerase/epimerase family protein n=1 Tax=Streptomyces mirabilis TaxID=68239 RepID=UPI0036CE5122